MKINDYSSYANISIKDLLHAREMFHVHFMKKRNVLATAIGRFRFRKDAPHYGTAEYEKYLTTLKNKEKTLMNTEVKDISWPCIIVFVKDWLSIDKFDMKDRDEIIPAFIYMPDGKKIPVCVIKAIKSEISDDSIDPASA